MDLSTLTNQSPKVMAVVEAIKNDPNFFSELKDNPQQALSKIGVELSEEEMGLVQKLGDLKELEAEAESFFAKIKGLFGFKEKDSN
ncbi:MULTISPECIES: hypothetical protein [Legionella]|uniref:Uncharacterized protein n=1 Tax=Legionella steelei TaxID=947033 RepID=A0A0W0ZIP6_9GAMM|nr:MULTISPECIES: hypothetical protein [Legionella]KTD68873.1 hypothetical protein Lste_2031 [Legionella steelei]MBN9227769.1 hypothetical protein [Legionella steelei]OJW14550.1 MAG: hypothetical protein BGO44_07710 [Legionella sp. 39-23]